MIEEEIFGYLNTGQKVVGAVCNRDERGWAAVHKPFVRIVTPDNALSAGVPDSNKNPSRPLPAGSKLKAKPGAFTVQF